MLRLEVVEWESGGQELEIFSVKMSGGGVVKRPKNLSDFRPRIYSHFLVNYEEMAKNGTWFSGSYKGGFFSLATPFLEFP